VIKEVNYRARRSKVLGKPVVPPPIIDSAKPIEHPAALNFEKIRREDGGNYAVKARGVEPQQQESVYTRRWF
jgi:hypothetical protein